jgi:HlyD family secretion protein
MKSSRLLPALLILFLIACDTNDELADAYGNFEAIEVMVSAESQGKIMAFEPEEGAALAKDQVTVVIDTAQLYLQKIQLESAQSALLTRIQTLDAQIRASQVQMNNLEREKQRIDKLAEGGAATAKQQDDIQGQIALLEAQIQATGRKNPRCMPNAGPWRSRSNRWMTGSLNALSGIPWQEFC